MQILDPRSPQLHFQQKHPRKKALLLKYAKIIKKGTQLVFVTDKIWLSIYFLILL